MPFPTGEFLVFFCVALVLVWGTRPLPRLQRAVLLVLSCVFYGFWDWRLLPLFLVSAVSAWGFGVLLGLPVADTRMAWARRRLFVFAVGLSLALLFWFKYQLLVLTQINTALLAARFAFLLPVHDAILPLGISFYTFQILSYLTDIYLGTEQARTDVVDVVLYLAFFPQLVAGPILRPAEFFPQLAEDRRLDRVPVNQALLLVLAGLWKKIVVASYLASLVVDPAFQDPRSLSAWEAWWALLAYGAQIYADFSGYTDLALGTALLLGFRLPRNFHRPYHAASLGEFWRRWHITLSRWLRDYLYIPLGGSRGRFGQTARNLLVTFLLGGLWHGANWTFVVWGGIHGSVLIVERAVGRVVSRAPELVRALWRPFGVVWTTAVVSLSWLFFRSPDLESATLFLGRLGEPGGFRTHPWAVALLLSVYVPQWLPERVRERMDAWARSLSTASVLLLTVLSIFGLSVLRPAGVPPFIYYQF